jgi:Spy/CpxP family protein refolding chaperone
MKRYLCAALAAALLMPGLWAVGARAQDDDAPPPERSEHHEGGMPDGGKMTDKIKKRLELTDGQAGKLKDAMKAHGEAVRPLVQRMKDGVKKLGGQLKAKAPDSDIQASLDALKAARKTMSDEQEKFQDALAGFLTPTQRAKMLIGLEMRMRRERADRGPKGRPARHGRMGGDDKDDDDGE